MKNPTTIRILSILAHHQRTPTDHSWPYHFSPDPPHNSWTRHEILNKKIIGNFMTMHKSTFSQNYFSHSSLEPRTSLCCPFAGLLTRYLAEAPSIHRTAAASEPSCFCQSINSKAAIIALFGPNRYRHPQFTRLFRRQPVRWLLMADTAGRPPQTEANYVKHRLLLVKSPWQVTGRAGQSSEVPPKI